MNVVANSAEAFVICAFEELAPRFVVRTHDSQPPHTHYHHYEFIWEELCDLFEDAGLAQGFWPDSWASQDDPRIGRMQPPVYRQIVSSSETRDFLMKNGVQRSVSAGRVLYVWLDLFSDYYEYGEKSSLSIQEGKIPMRAIYSCQLRRLHALGFARIYGEFFRWHPLVLEAFTAGKHWDRILYPYNKLEWPLLD